MSAIEEDNVRIEIGFDGTQIMSALVTPETADELEAALKGGSNGSVVLDAEDGRYTVPLTPRAAGTAFVTEVRSMSLGLRLWLAGLMVVMGAAAIAALLALPPGWEVFGTTPSFEWGLMIVGYVFFAIMTSGP